MPRLSPSAISASCWAARAGLVVERVAKMAPAMADPVTAALFCGAAGRPDLGRLRREICLVGLGELAFFVFVLKHLALSIAIDVAIVAAIFCFFEFAVA